MIERKRKRLESPRIDLLASVLHAASSGRACRPKGCPIDAQHARSHRLNIAPVAAMDAVQLYRAGKYAEAAAAFESLAQTETTPRAT